MFLWFYSDKISDRQNFYHQSIIELEKKNNYTNLIKVENNLWNYNYCRFPLTISSLSQWIRCVYAGVDDQIGYDYDYYADEIEEARTAIVSTFNNLLNIRLQTVRDLNRLADMMYKKQGSFINIQNSWSSSKRRIW